jgi:hypothetical protein
MDHFPLSWGRPRNETSIAQGYNAFPMHHGQTDYEAKAFGLEGQHGSKGAVEHTQ